MLRNSRDWQAVLYLTAQTLLVIYQWNWGIFWLAYVTVLFLSVGVSSIHHNHAHLKMWRARWLNRATDFWITLLQGHPTFVFYATHNANHHRFHHGTDDVARTYRFGGDTNNLVGYLLHPAHAVRVLAPLFLAWLFRWRKHQPGVFWYFVIQYLAVGILWSGLAFVDCQKWLLIVLLPQLFGLHWLLASNYLQHAHADGRSRINFARNFEGMINPLLFNAGLHTAHHFHERSHWSELPEIHERYRKEIDPRLNERGLASYIFRTYLLSLFVPRLRSESLMRAPDKVDTRQTEEFEAVSSG